MKKEVYPLEVKTSKGFIVLTQDFGNTTPVRILIPADQVPLSIQWMQEANDSILHPVPKQLEFDFD